MPLKRPTSLEPIERGLDSELVWRRELARKALHVAVVAIPIVMLRVDAVISLVTLGIGSVIAISADVLRTRNERFERFIVVVFGRMMRPNELPSNARVRFNGATLLLTGCFLAALLFGTTDAAYATLVFLIADAAAGIVGKRFGRRHWGPSAATVEGSTAFFVVALAVASFVPALSLAETVVVAAAAAAVEGLTPVDDNLVVPVALSALLYLL